MTLQEVLHSVGHKYGDDSVQEGVELKAVDRLPLPARAINRMLYGGLPHGRIIEFSGAEHSGKTTTALLAIAAEQRLHPDKKCVFVDAEGTYDSIWARKLGVDNSRLIKITPENMTAEECLQIIEDIAGSGEAGIIVLDSIPALVPQQEDVKSLSEYTMGGVSKPLTVFSRKMQRKLIKYPDTIFIAINQLRDNISGYGAPTTTVGGRMWKATCSVRIEFKGYNIDETCKPLTSSAENVAGAMIKASLIKNKTAPRDRKSGQYYVLFDSGFNEVQDVVNAAIAAELVQRSGPSFRFIDTETGKVLYKAQGIANFIQDMPPEIYRQLSQLLEEQDV